MFWHCVYVVNYIIFPYYKSFSALILNMEENSTDVIVPNENLINAVENEPRIWNSKLDARFVRGRETVSVDQIITGVVQYTKSKLIYLKVCHAMSSVHYPKVVCHWKCTLRLFWCHKEYLLVTSWRPVCLTCFTEPAKWLKIEQALNVALRVCENLSKTVFRILIALPVKKFWPCTHAQTQNCSKL